MLSISDALQQGMRHHQAGQIAEAEQLYRQVLAQEPRQPQALYLLGLVALQASQFRAAADLIGRAIDVDASQPVFYANLGEALRQLDDRAGAIAALERALALDPQLATARLSLGTLLYTVGRYDDALKCFRELQQRAPRHAGAHAGAGNALQALGRLPEAIECYRAAIEIDPGLAAAHNNLGVAYTDLGRREEAIASCRAAIALDPSCALAHSNIALALQALGQLDEAIEYHRQTVALAPDAAAQHSNLVYALNYHPRYDRQTLFDEHRVWAARHADPLTAASLPHANDRDPQRRLRIGYVSPHFLAHAVNFFVEPILAHHDAGQFEIVCYSDVVHEDDTTHRLRGHARHWRSTLGLTDQQVAEQVRRDAIDILVDLTGHIGGNRLLAFARKPAPVQVTYIGYQNTTGMQAMDYRLTDAWSDPPGETDAYYSETLVRLPRTFFTYLPSPDAPLPGPLPMARAGHVTFGSFNHFSKVTPQVLAAWAEILRRLPTARLLMLADMSPSLAASITAKFAAEGIGAERLILRSRAPRADYLRMIDSVDIALDPFPFNGHTTTCDCLWQGVPVVSLAGNSYVSRFGSSALATLKLHDWIASSIEDYVVVAVRQSREPAVLANIRAGLRERMAASAILDAAGFVRELEAAYRQMWRTWCKSGA